MDNVKEKDFELVPFVDSATENPISVRFDQESAWLSKAQMADLFAIDKRDITYHINNIYYEGELTEGATSAEIALVQTEGSRRVTRKLKIYNLDVIISVGYRVNSKRGTQFRQWATSHLRNIILKGHSEVMPAEVLVPADYMMQMQKTLADSQAVMMQMGAKYDIALTQLKAMMPKAAYCDRVLASPDCCTTTLIAKDLGMSAVMLNKRLHELGIQFKQGGTWLLYAPYQNLGLTDIRTHCFTDSDQTSHTRETMVWTQLGRAFVTKLIGEGMSTHGALMAASGHLTKM